MQDVESEAFRQFVRGMEDAWNAGDADGWVAAFAEDVDFVNIYGGYHKSREKIRRSHQYLFTGIYENSHNELIVEQIRPLREDLFCALVVTRLAHKKGRIEGRMTMVVERNRDGFQILWFHNGFITTPEHHGTHDRAAQVNPQYST